MNEMDLMEAMQIIANAGLMVTTPQGEVKKKAKRKVKARRSKGSGSVYKLSGTRSKPYVASVTLGYSDEDGHQIKKPIGYYKTQEEAQNALDVYNMQRQGLIKNTGVVPTIEELQKDKVKCPTVKEIWDIIFEEDIKKKTKSTIVNYGTAFRNLHEIHDYQIDQVNLHVLQPIFDKYMKEKACSSKLNNMKIICKSIFNYAMKYDYISKDYSSYIKFVGTTSKTIPREIYTIDEINLLKKENSFGSQLILISIFTGLRPQELMNIEKENIYLNENYMIAGMKTKSGKDRIIPIHDFIKPFIENLTKENIDSEYLVYDCNGKYAYEKYRWLYIEVMKKLKLNHVPYDTRHTFATLSKLANVNEFARKKIMGHSCNDLTDDVYTHAPIEYLIKEVNKIKIESE